MTWLLIAALSSTAVWVGLLLFWHGFWRARPRLPAEASAPHTAWPDIVAVIPARDEAPTIAAVVAAHGASVYPGHFAVIVVDDGSRDGTAALAAGAARPEGPEVMVVPAPVLRAGWSGKMAAVAAGIAAVEATNRPPFSSARYLLLTDADIVHAPDTLTRLVSLAERQDLAMVSLMARLETGRGLGRLLVPAYVFFFQKLYPFQAVASPSSRIAGAAGGCMLVSRAALQAAGGIAAIRGALIDDCALAGLLKCAGGRLWLGLAGDEVVSSRDTGRPAVIWQTVVRTAYVQLRRSPLMLAGCVVGMAFLYLSGPVAAVTGAVSGAWPLLASGTAAWILQAVAFAPTLAALRVPRTVAPLLPLAGLLYTLMTLDSAWRDWAGRGAPWKGRTYGDDGAGTAAR
ncbi:MAG: glycosyltransferase [Pseudomonadota bacterium]